MDPAVSDAVLGATLDLLEERGYAGLRVDDVAARAGTGLGAVYRRFRSKRELIVAAVRSLLDDDAQPQTGDAEEDLLAGLVAIAEATAGRRGALILSLLADPRGGELPGAIRAAKLEPLLAANRERLRRLAGDADDLDVRADLGPALIVLRSAILGRGLTRDELREQVLPLMLSDASRRGRRVA